MAVKKLAETGRVKKAAPVVEKKIAKTNVVAADSAPKVKPSTKSIPPSEPKANEKVKEKEKVKTKKEAELPTSISAPKSAAVNAARRAKKGEARKARNAASLIATKVTKENGPSDIIYIGHVPAGFEEREMRKFFAQFGDVVRLKLARNKKTLASRGHAFVKFESVATATTVSEAINGYFIGERQLVSHVVPRSKVHEGLLRTGPRSASSKRKADQTEALGDEDEDDDDSADADAAAASAPNPTKAAASLRKKQKKLDSLGIQYDFLGALVKSSAGIVASEAKRAAAPIPSPPVDDEEEEEEEKPVAVSAKKSSKSGKKK
jgi:nucleolar protein 15